MSRTKRQKRGRPGLSWRRCLAAGVSLGFGAFLISVVLVAFVFFSYAKSFLQGLHFHQMVEDKLAAALKSEVALGQLRWEGASAFTDRINGRGSAEASFAKFGLAGLRADLNLSVQHFKRRVWKVTAVSISQLDVLFSQEGRLTSKGWGSAHPEPREPEGGPSRNLVPEFLPRELELDELRCNTLNLYWDTPGAQGGATGMEAVFRPAPGDGGCAVKVRGGAVQGSVVPKLGIDLLDLYWRNREISVNQAKLHSESGGLVTLQGDIHLAENGKPGTMKLNAEVSQLSLSRMVQNGAQPRVQGDLEIVARIEGDPGDLKNSRQEGRVTVRNGVVETLPILQMLARFTGSKRFERIALRDGGGAKFVRTKGRTEFTGIDFQSDGLARLTGEMVVQEGNLDGLLQLGVIPGTLSWIPAAEQKIFTEARDGHLWTTVQVSGTVDHPQQDLTARLASAGVEAAVDALGQILDGGAKKENGGTGGNMPQGATGQLGKAIDLGRELLKGFLR